MLYRLFTPPNYDRRKKYRLVLWLHGSGGDGKIDRVPSANITPSKKNGLWRLLGQPGIQSEYPSFVLVPRCPPGERWDNIGSNKPSTPMRLVLEVLQALGAEFGIDRRRLSVIGYSLGGYGTWDVVARRPGMFAAAVPISGGGDAYKAHLIAQTPVWAFHGREDEAVNVGESRRMVEAVRKAGGNPVYTEYAGVGHLVTERVLAEPDLLPWIFAQRRNF
ncbi:MAG TPA: prolyl oligopeptidase family serine peptidase [Pyrinomonadaceae bacterium]